MTWMIFAKKPALCLAALTLLIACGGGDGGGSGIVVDEVDDPDYTNIGTRGVAATEELTLIYTDGSTPQVATTSLDYQDGILTGSILDGQDLDGVVFSNPASGEYSRVFRLSGTNNYLGAVGILPFAGDNPTSGTTDYNLGWVSITASDPDVGTYVLEGSATFTSNWDSGAVNGEFTDLSGTLNDVQNVSNIGTITLSSNRLGTVSFFGGTSSGTGAFDVLNNTPTNINGRFYGPLADELGGFLIVDPANADGFELIGVFQAD